MGFPWKKVKSSSRISQMVKDQFHHRKNAASPLVVETGFPTSLVDLIVNHRDRFKKPSPSPRFKKKPPPPPPPFDPPQSPLPPPAPSPTPLPPTSPVPSPPRTPIATTDAHEIDDSGEGQEGAYSNKALVALLKIFLLVVLALGAKKFAVGITFSAFFLFFVDYLARNVFRYEHLVPCPEVRENLRLIISRVVRLEEEPLQKEGSLELPPESSQFEEIQIVAPIDKVPSYCGKSFRPEGIKSMAELIEEDEDIYEVPESKNVKSRRAKMKSRMKKLFPKRIGKTGKDPKLEINPTREENEYPECPERGLEPPTMAMNITPDVKDSNSLEKSDFVERETNYGYLFLILVALVGLVTGGRIYALLLTLMWCFLSKVGGAIRRSVKVS
ncbi:PREDICTED: uncharacterized protein LOC109174047 [Ipomoea nil]|uniref:uncharacterized protein LOC109174047 n=1 Tax=Ipomoea nil TaxID=35883 RepID=UPI000901D5AE|nr:PREDICTED: uncharacterized protein LOC109174047 [Ipomoea nil]